MLPNETIKNLFSFFIRIFLSFVLMAWLFSKIDLAKMGEVLKSADLRFIGLALIIFLAINFVLLIRWFVFIVALGLKVKFFDVLRNFFIGLFCNLFLPSAIGGDIVKAFGLSRHSEHKARVVASVILDRLSGFGGVVLVAIVAFCLGNRWVNDAAILWMIAALTLFSLGVFIFLLNEKLYSAACQIFNRIPRVKKAFMGLHNDFALVKGKPKEVAITVGLSCLTQVVLAVIFFLILRGLNHELSLIYFLIFSPLVCVAAALPSIGGLGVREFGWVYFLSKMGVASDVSLSMSLISFLFMVIVGLLGGLIYVVTVSSGRVQYRQPNPAAGREKS